MTASLLLTTDAVPARDRVGFWGDAVQRSFGRLRSQTYGDEGFRGEIRGFQLEDPREATRTITSILLGAGFSSAAHFSRLFRQRYGASPREWRQSTQRSKP
ncbi:MAG TPA: AraC family transcriptional regulator [Burkholderiales bacterium]|nr:AraC family transcriptional regulator [Burkholderiales bacterium]